MRSLGCFVDNGHRDLPVVYNAQHQTTKAFCWKYCRARGYKYFGLQAGYQCTCGNTFGRYGRAKAKECNRICKGDKRAKCGGSWRNQIFTTGLTSKKMKGSFAIWLSQFVSTPKSGIVIHQYAMHALLGGSQIFERSREHQPTFS